MAEYAYTLADAHNDLREVKNRITRKEDALTSTEQKIEKAKAELESAVDERAYKRAADELASLRKEKERIGVELVELQRRETVLIQRLPLPGRKRGFELQEENNGLTRFHEELQALGVRLFLPDSVAELQVVIANVQMPQLRISEQVYTTLTDQNLIHPNDFDWVQPAANDAELALQLSNNLLSAIIRDASVADTEDTMHFGVDLVLASTCKEAFRGRKRNKSEQSSAGRPDFFVPVTASAVSIVVLRGEEKLASEVSKSHPRDELIQNTPWDDWAKFYGNLPYVFGYFAIGHPQELLVQFGCLAHATRGFVPIGRQYNLATAADRAHSFLFFLKLVPFLRAAANRASGASLNMLWEDDRTNGITLRYAVIDGETRVRKKYSLRSAPQASQIFNAWVEKKNFFASIMGSKNFFVPILEMNFEGRDVAVHFPLCEEVRMIAENVAMATYHVIEALEVLHAHGCVHNDIRWPNVMFSPAVRRFVLIDFDDSALLDDRGLAPPVGRLLNAESHAPNIREEHGTEVDVWGVGYLMRTQRCVEWLLQLGVRILDPAAQQPTLVELKQAFLQLA